MVANSSIDIDPSLNLSHSDSKRLELAARTPRVARIGTVIFLKFHISVNLK